MRTLLRIILAREIGFHVPDFVDPPKNGGGPGSLAGGQTGP